MKVKKEIKFIFTDDEFKQSMSRPPKDENELNDWADFVIGAYEASMIDAEFAYQDAKDYYDNNGEF